MKRFEFDSEDEDDNDEMTNQGFFSMIPMDSEEDLMDQSIRICEKNFFWKFYSIDKKIKDLEKIYYFLLSVQEEGDEGDEGDE